jgi:hypothetical protein
METNWQTAPIILVPIFTGSVFAGHWSGFTVDRMIQIGPTGIRVYKDSLPPQLASNDLKRRLSPTPLVEDTNTWVTADTPLQEAGSNNCAVWICCGFTAYLKAAYEKPRLTGVAGQVAVKMELNGLSTREWGL